jgi:PAS domain S-box-containing protein
VRGGEADSDGFGRRLIDRLPVAVYRTSADGRLLLVNQHMARMFGYHGPEEMMGLRAPDLYADPGEAEELRRLLADRDVLSQRRCRMVRRDGTPIWVDETVRAIRDGDGRLCSLEGILQDVSEARRAQQALSRSETMYRSLFQNAGDALFIVEDGRFVDCNRATERIFGLSREDVLGATPARLSPPAQPTGGDSGELSRQRLVAALSGRPQFFSWTHRRGDGTDFPAEVSLVRVDVDGRRLVQARVHDITERQRVLEELTARERVLETVSMASTLFLGSIPWRDSIVEVLDRIARATGAVSAMLLFGNGRESGRFLSSSTPDRLRGSVEGCLEDDDPNVPARLARMERPFLGSRRRFSDDLTRLLGRTCSSCLAMPVRVEGAPWGVLLLASSRDEAFPAPVVDACSIAARLIAAAVSAERYRTSLATEKEKLEVTLSAIEDAVITLDMSGRVLLFNRAAEELTGEPAGGVRGRHVAEVLKLRDPETDRPFDWKTLSGLASRALEESSDPGRECVWGRDGKRRMRLSVRCLSSPAEGYVLILRDTTWETRLAEEKARSQRLESLGVLAGGIAHDFNNSLTAIISGLELSKLRGKGEEVDDILQEVERAAVSARGLTRQLLTFSRGGAPVARPMRIAGMIRDTAGFVLSGTNCDLAFSAGQGLWPVKADESQISQVVNNLVLNARQSMPSGGTISIRLTNREVGPDDGLPLPPGRYVMVEIEDQGTGIPEELLPRIFDPYFTTKGEGSGLGLATTHSIITRHGGYIEVDSSPGEGSCFSILLPAAGEGPEEREGEASRIRLRGRVLLMDDDRSVLITASQLMEALGCTVETAPHGQAAIDAYRRAMEEGEGFDAVIMDLTVQGGMGGAAAAREIADMDPDARLVVSSGYSNDPVMADFADYGFIDCIAKPYTMQELRDLLARVMAGGSR